jgi:UDPglucose 6-dehydrogenase
MKIGCLGLGKLGLPFALTLAYFGEHDVFGWDTSADVRARVFDESENAHSGEPEVARLLNKLRLPFAWSSSNGSFEIQDPPVMNAHCDVVFIVVPTPSLPSGRFDTAYVVEAIDSVAPKVEGAGHPIIGLVSTVSPGSCRRLQDDAVTWGFANLVYCPVMIALGSVVHDLRNAEVQILGDRHQSAKTRQRFVKGSVSASVQVGEVLRTIHYPACRESIMSFESAELAKLATNMFGVLKVSYANQLGQIAHEHDANIDDVIGVLAAQSGIGKKWLTPGGGWGGPCWPRDVDAYQEVGGSLGAVAYALNEEHLNWVLDRCGIFTGRSGYELLGKETFTVLGKPYKSGTTYRIESFGDHIAYRLDRFGVFEIDDPAEADLIVIALPCTEKKIKPKKGALVLDLWRTHPYLADMQPDVEYVAFGAMA